MKNLILILSTVALSACVTRQPATRATLPFTYLAVNPTTGALVAPTNFYTGSISPLTNALTAAGFSSGGTTLTDSASLRSALSDESGTGAAIFAGGNIGAATATSPAADDNGTRVPTTAWVQGELHAPVTVSGTYDYLTLSGQDIVRGQVDLATDVTGNLPVANLAGGSGATGSTFWRGDGTWAAPSASGGSVWFDGVELQNPDFDSNWFLRNSISGTNRVALPALPVIASGTSATPDASATTEFIYTMTGNFTLNAISNCTTNHARDGIEFTLIQGGSGGYQPSFATNYLFNDVFPGITLVWTNVGYRAVFRVKPRRDNVAVYDVVQFVDGMVP